MKLNVYLTVADFVRPERDKSKLEISGIIARYIIAGSRMMPGRWSFLAAEVEVPDHVGLDAEGASIVVTLEAGDDNQAALLPDEVPILGSWINEHREAKDLRYVPAKNLIAHAERKDFGFALVRRYGYGFKAG